MKTSMIRSLIVTLLFNSMAVCHAPLLVIVLMVKNEAQVINATLEPFVKEGLDSFLIFDTGSTDGTVQTVKDYFTQHLIEHGYVEEEPFIDFATSRNHALDAAQKKFPDATFMLMLDAEWYMQNVKGFIDFCASHKEDSEKSYLIKITAPNLEFYTPRLLRCKSCIRFVGAVHEVPNVPANIKVDPTCYFELNVSRFGYEKSLKRWERDAGILLKAFKENPHDSRTTFYLAQTYECLGDLQNAYTYYLIRSHQPGWDEENYETFYRLGRVSELLSHKDKNFTWAMAFDYYMTAFKMRPHRAEPLIKVAEHYWPDNIPLCYLFARRALDLPHPKDEILFVDKDIYEYSVHEVLSKSAWHVGEFEIGERATEAAIKVRPLMAHLHRNLECYKSRRESR